MLKQLRNTEGDDQYDYDYLEGEWKKGKHRKYYGTLTRKQFGHLVVDCDLVADSAETMGSMVGFGEILPAISFNSEDSSAIINAYVTPIPEFESKRPHTPEQEERDWKRIKQAVLNLYGD